MDAVLIVAAHVLAYGIRFEFSIGPQYWRDIFTILPYLVSIKILTFYFFGLYKGMWRYTSLNDILTLGKATVLSSLILMSGILMISRFQGFSRAVFVLDGILTFLLLGGTRGGLRYLYQRRIIGGKETEPKFSEIKKKSIPVLIYGAGDAGEKTLREILDNPTLEYDVKGFIDDNPSKRGQSIHGYSVLGDSERLKGIAQTRGIKEILIAVPSAKGPEMRKIIAACEAVGVTYKTLPGIGEIIDGKVSLKELRDVSYQDLLGRPAVELNQEAIGDYIHDKTVLVTGAGGSIGAELCRQICRFNPKQLVMVDVSEPDLYNIQMELKHRIQYLQYATVLTPVQNRPLMDLVFKKYNPQAVFHAAAYKHVPMIERNPWQAVENNIIGTQTVLEKAVEHGAERFILVSTDKAVRPTNVMGASKRVCERILNAYLGDTTKVMAVRFGNVVGSAGSVIPLFRSQIEKGGPVTVTHPEVTRYFMTIPESCQLILQAGALGKGGEIFILEMGTPVKIADMARDVIRLSGKEPDKDIEIVYTGLRAGEKLYEELITEGEGIVRTEHEKIKVIESDGAFNGFDGQEGYRAWLTQKLDDLYQVTSTYDPCAIREKLKEFVPEYTPSDSECVL